MTQEYAMERQNLADRADAQEGAVPHMDLNRASFDVFRWALKRNACMDVVMNDGYEKLAHLHPSLYTWHEVEVEERANGGPRPRRKKGLCITPGCKTR